MHHADDHQSHILQPSLRHRAQMTTMNELQAAADRRIGQLLLAELQKVCRLEGIPVSGKKADLQTRLRSLSTAYSGRGDEDRLRRLRDRLLKPNSASNPASHQHASTFRPSPFFVNDRRLAHLQLSVSKDHRNVAAVTFSLSQADAAALMAPNMRILLYSAARLPASEPLDVAFPQQLEIRVNDNEVKANTRGIKNRPGTTKPVDITPFVRKRSDIPNKVAITYALTDKIYQVHVWLAKKKSIEELITEVQRRVIRKDRTLAEIRAKADDPDIITTSTNMKLKDPVSFMRIQTPCRGSSCEHVGCFDLQTYLSMQEQAPQWECPLCSKKAPFASLAVDEYVQEILAKTSSSDEQVTIGVDGRWTRDTGANASKSNGSGASAYNDDDDSDDLIEISGPRPTVTIKAEVPNTPSSITTPSVAGDGHVQPRGQKRQAEVIDLTLSEDDEPPNKRPNNNSHRQSSVQSQSHYDSNYPYSARSPMSFTIPYNANPRFGTDTQTFTDQSVFNPPSTSFSRAIFGLPGIGQSQNTIQNQNRNQSQNQQRQSWPMNNHFLHYPNGDL